MTASLKLRNAFNRLKSVFSFQKPRPSAAIEGASEAESCAKMGPSVKPLPSASGDVEIVDTSKWKTIDSRALGITWSNIPFASRKVLRVLQSEGHDAFLVGGCVRDLLLNKIPKDFDVITTANLKEIKKKFHRAFIVGRRFPICMVHISGLEIEVSSFETLSSHDMEGKEKVKLPEMPGDYDEKDLLLWENSLHRDFTVNSLFYDPFAHKIYDYSNAMADLTAMKLRTLVPACSSFQKDCARILRGLRIAARLGFSFEENTEKAIHNLHASVQTLDKTRLLMEMNYMLSYGAAQSSLLLLKKFNLLQILLPFQAAYLADHPTGQTPMMLMKLLSNLDNVVSCDQPCDTVLWVSLLVFHLALVNNPQDARVVWTFASLLYHGSWKEGVIAAREFSEEHISFAPEIFNSFDDAADEELAQRVSQFASIIIDSIGVLTDSKSLCEIMKRYQSSPCADVVFISKNAGRAVAEVFNVFAGDITSLKKKRQCYGIEYELLGKGDIVETRFVLGKVMMDTMSGGITQRRTKLLSEKKEKFYASKLKVGQVEPRKPKSKVVKHEIQNSKGREKRNVPDVMDNQITKKQKQNKMPGAADETLVEKGLGEILGCQGTAMGEQHLRKKVMENVTKLHFKKEEMSKQYAKLKPGQHCDFLTPKEIPTTVKKVPKMEEQHQILAPDEILCVLEKAPNVGKQYNSLTSEETLNVLRSMPKVSKQHKDQDSEETLNVLRSMPKVSKQHKDLGAVEISNMLNRSNTKGSEDPSKNPSKLEKQPIMEENCRDESKKKRKTQLSSLFK